MAYNREYLESKCNVSKLKHILIDLSGVPGTKNKSEIIEEILKIQSGEIKPLKSNRGRPRNEEKNRIPSSDGKVKIFDHENVFDYGTEITGIFEPCPDGYGFLRVENYSPSQKDAFVARPTVRTYNVLKGDKVYGKIERKRENELPELTEVYEINDKPFEDAKRVKFDELVATYPDKRLDLAKNNIDASLKIIDLLCPIGFGQRGLIVAPPKAGKTTLLKKIAYSIENNHKDVHLIVLLIDERPEEVTDFKSYIKRGEVISSTFDESPEHHTKVCELALSRAMRLCEQGENVFILMDSITKLTRAYNLIVPSSGKTLSGGIDPASFTFPKRLFGSARNTACGSLTVVATCLVETGSKMDEVIFEEFKGTGNMEIILSRELSENRVFPAIDVKKSSTRKEELLLSKDEYELSIKIRRSVKDINGVVNLIDLLERTKSTKELIAIFNKQ